VLAFVLPAEGVDHEAISAAVQEHCADRLARFKQPSRVVVVTGLPHSATGKVAKGRLRALARSDDLGLRAQ
jgi:long-chain acyl-CoA synthetase